MILCPCPEPERHDSHPFVPRPVSEPTTTYQCPGRERRAEGVIL